MFTGIIESLGRIEQVTAEGQGRVLTIGCDLDLSETRIGDSIAVNGACLTAVSISGGRFTVDMAPETVSRTTFRRLAPGARVNIERALKLSARIDGHLVSGHIDGTGTIAAMERLSNAVIVRIQAGSELCADMIEKGSVAIDGISLTINEITDTDFSVSIIPHTAAVTTIGFKQSGDPVNIETDMIGKYVRKQLAAGASANDAQPSDPSGISMALLADKGFL